MKLLITGATGLIGRKLTEKFLNEDFDINYLTTVKSKISTIEGAKGFYWNPSQDQIDSKCFSGVDTIIHLAGSTVSKRWSKSYKKKIYSSRIKSTQILLRGLKI
ncbi:MAG: NAD-dependent epimerase, partial [Flavobacteriaceae bacterium]|nr:NAD-dependent epimerase [Flavobacteriaceae bacterium]